MNTEIKTVAGLVLHKTSEKYNAQLETEYTYFEYMGKQYQAHLLEDYKHADKPWSYRKNTGRAFVWDNPKVSDKILLDEAEKLGLTSIYSEKGKYPTLDAAWKKYNRMEVKSMTGLLEAACNAMGLTIEKVTFSRYAGCSCPCSPGFIIKLEGVPGYFDLFVSEKEEEKPEPVKETPNRFELGMEE